MTLKVDHKEAGCILAASQGVILAGHVQIDGDCLGSELGLMHALQRQGKRVAIYNQDPVPRPYRFLPGADQVRKLDDLHAGPPWDLVLAVDTPTRERLGSAGRVCDLGLPVLVIDHHPGEGFGEHAWVDTSASSVGEMAYLVLEGLGWPVEPDGGLCLYTAIITDTGRFSYSNTTARTHRIAGALLEAGVDATLAVRKVYQSRALSELKLIGLALANIRLAVGGQVSWCVLTPELLHAAQAENAAIADLPDVLKTADGVHTSLLFREAPQHGRIKVSIRSDGVLDANRLAAAFGGGGHVAAAGANVVGSLDDVARRVMSEVENHADKYRLGSPPASA